MPDHPIPVTIAARGTGAKLPTRKVDITGPSREQGPIVPSFRAKRVGQVMCILTV